MDFSILFPFWSDCFMLADGDAPTGMVKLFFIFGIEIVMSMRWMLV
jgi:hypothetical protein